MNSIASLFYILAFSSLLSAAHAATPQQVWVQRYDGPGAGADNAFAMAVDRAGNVFVTGESTGVGSGYDIVTLKYSNAGVPLWTNRYNGPANGADAGNALMLDANGDAVVTGSSGNGDLDCVTLKYSSAGVPLWTNRYLINGDSALGTAVTVDTNNNVLVAGYSYSSGIKTLKYSSAGVPLWTNSYIGPNNLNHYAAAIAADSGGNVLITGFSTGLGSGDDYVTLKYSSVGVPLWTNRFNGEGNGNDEANALAVDGNGDVLVTGYGVNASGWGEYATIKYSSDGTPLWTNHLSGPGGGLYFGASDLAVDGSNNVVVTGTLPASGNQGDFVTIKYSEAGVPLWTNRAGLIYDDRANALALDRNGNVFVTGYVTDPVNLRFDIYTVAYASTGAGLWTNRYNGTGDSDDTGNAVAVDANGNVMVAGYSFGATYDLVTIQYGFIRPPLNVRQTTSSIVLSWTNSAFILQAAPGPDATFTNIPSATSPYTNFLTGAAKFFRLKAN